MNINWEAISAAISYYDRNGFKYIEVPWAVPDWVSAITCPIGNEYTTGLGTLVGSAEQGFMYMASENLLDVGRYVACTPCFRNEPVDDLHQKYFMKVELYSNNPLDTPEDFVQIAFDFFREYSNHVRVVKTSDGYDIELNGIELGSYGRRSGVSCGTWVYGTGVAEPRLSTALLKI